MPVSSLRAYATVEANPPGVSGLHIDAPDLNQRLPVDIRAESVDNALTLTAQTGADGAGRRAAECDDLIALTHPDCQRIGERIGSFDGAGTGVLGVTARSLDDAATEPTDL